MFSEMYGEQTGNCTPHEPYFDSYIILNQKEK